MLIMALNGVCGKTSPEDTFQYIIGGKLRKLFIGYKFTSLNSFPTLHNMYVLKTLPYQEKVSQVAFCTFSGKRNVE